MDGTGQLLDAVVSYLVAIYRRISGEYVFKASLENGPIYLHEVGATRKVLDGCLTRGVYQGR
jgi:hypothetical protein